MAEAFAPAKVNLALHVTGQRADGYHLLDSLVAFANVGDRVWVERCAKGTGLSLSVIGPMSDGVPTGNSNIVLQAAQFAGVEDCVITLDKVLPAQAGIGGGSSDAAAILRALDAIGAISEPLKGLEQLGADVPVCFEGRACRMRGTGEQVERIEGLPELPALLVNPRIPVPTPPVFQMLAQKTNSPMPERLPEFADTEECVRWLATLRNDLEEPAAALHSGISVVLEVLSQLEGALLARMSGSGSTCFALFSEREKSQEAGRMLQAKYPGWWIAPCLLT